MKKKSLENLIANWDRSYKWHTREKYYAWRPVKDVYGVWHWREYLYRLVGNTYVDYDDFTWYFYLTEEDLTFFLLRWS